MRIVVAGAAGQLGGAVLAACAAESPSGVRGRSGGRIEAFGYGSGEMNITDPESVRAVLAEVRPDVVVNCAAYTAVDAAESDEAAATAVNALGAETLAAACAVAGARMVHVSTDYVFDGGRSAAAGPYEPDDPVGPRTVYGRTKLAGEQRVRAACPDALIVRTAWVYTGAPGGRDFVATMRRLERERETIAVVDDQRGSPTYAPDLAAGIVEAAWGMRGGADSAGSAGGADSAGIAGGLAGRVLHAAGGGEATWFDLAQEVFRRAGADPQRVIPCATHDMPRPAPRPAYSVLSGLAWERAGLTPLRQWRDALAAAMANARADAEAAGS